jgi:hypothetical protein
MAPTLDGIPFAVGHGGLTSADVTKDFAGNRFDCYLRTDDNDTAIHIIKRDPQGNIIDDAVVIPDGGPNGARKLNSASLKVSGSDLVVVATGYDFQSTPTRINYQMGAIWQGIATPFPVGMNPELGGGGPMFPQPPDEQIFTDVPPGHTFYPFVQHLASIGAIGGYPCGGPNEPCDTENRPYFRPDNTLTRGQISKIISLATGSN